MTYLLFSAAGCSRCKITKAFMQDRSIGFEEHDIKAEGRERFNRFYREHRDQIYRSAEGIEFPILAEGEQVIQGVAPIMARLLTDTPLTGYVARNQLGPGWIDGLNVSAGDPAQGEPFLSLIRALKQHGLQIQLTADGRNATLLETIAADGLVDRLQFQLWGPPALYAAVTGRALAEEDLNRSLDAAVTAPDFQLILMIGPIDRPDRNRDYLSPAEAAQTAEAVARLSGSNKLPFTVRAVAPAPDSGLETLPPNALFKYRTACRRYQVKTEIIK